MNISSLLPATTQGEGLKTPCQTRPETIPGILMLFAIGLALVAANTPFQPLYQAIHHTPVHVRIGPLIAEGPLIVWINRGLMTGFFFLVGLEIKREILEGCLSYRGGRLLPAVAALGGIATPAAIYLAIASSSPEAARGWAIPTATDIVVAIGLVSLLGDRVPRSLGVLLMAVAIFDDIGAALIIGLFYGHEFEMLPFVAALLAVLLVGVLNRARGVSVSANLLAALLVWLGFYAGGIEPALAGFPLALAIPLQARDGVATHSSLLRTEKWFRPRVALIIVPVFAFLNAGIRVDLTAIGSLREPSSLGILGGLMIGKPLGIFGAITLMVALGLARLPAGLSRSHVFGISLIAGAGFTMSFFLVALSFDSPALAGSARLAVLVGSTVSGVAGLLFLWMKAPPVSSYGKEGLL